MKISGNWLKEFIPNIKINDKLTYNLTSLGLEVSSVVKHKGDLIIDIDMTPNRADCLSMLGIARDLSAVYNKKIIFPKIANLKITPSKKFINKIDKKICGSYGALVLHGVDNTIKTPNIIAERLNKCGISKVNFIVDILNYVMIEVGQPMHAFDLDKINRLINVRYAKANEKINALDGVKYTLNKNIPVIADDNKIQAIAGIIGGDYSSINLKTQNVIIESAFFTPTVIRKAAKLFRLQTDASYRFERGVDPCLNNIAAGRVLYLMKKYSNVKNYQYNLTTNKEFIKKYNHVINVKYNFFDESLGVQISRNFIKKTFKLLEFNPISYNDKIRLTIPSHRFDIKIEQDLVEEIARVYGYDNFEPALPHNIFKINKDHSIFSENIINGLVSRGFNEIISFSFLPKNSQLSTNSISDIIKIKNPISEDKSELRASMVHSMIRAYKYNVSRQNTNIKIFEIGKIYNFVKPKKIKENNILSGIISGINAENNLKSDQENLSFLDLKGHLQRIIPNIAFKPYKNIKHLNKFCQATLYQGKHTIGYCGEISQNLYSEYGINNNLYYFEIFTDSINNVIDTKYKKFSIYPKIKRDLTILVDDKIYVQDIIDIIGEKSFNYMINSKIRDIFYNKKEFGDNIKSITLEFIFQDCNSTLTDNTVNTEMDKILSLIKKHFNAQVRT